VYAKIIPFNKEAIMLPILDRVETHLVDHCNLSCKGCSHYSPLAPKNFTNVGKFKKDMAALSKKVGISYLRLLGGEPLLHPDITKFIKYARRYFPQTLIGIATNGILLPKMKNGFWTACRKNNIQIEISQYQVNEKKIDEYCNLVRNKDCKLGIITVGNKFSYIINIKGDSDMYAAFNKCRADYKAHHNIYQSKIHLCGRCYNGILAKYHHIRLPVSEGIDFYKASGEEIYEYLNKPNELCRYCFVERIPFDWDISDKSIGDWIYDENMKNIGGI
jgi:uncharacterized radical SAM superfamily Fe-S cluster-containing enzyme